MDDSYLKLNMLQVGSAAGLILVNGVISIILRLGMERSLLIAAARTIVQLLLIGLVLRWVFQLDQWYVVLLLAMVMSTIAGVAAVQRTDRRYPGIWIDSIVSVWASSLLISCYALVVVVRPTQNWYQPQYSIPLLGMILGNTLTGISLGLNRLGEELIARRDLVETLLALGANRWEAARAAIRRAVRTGMTPIINSMAVVGLVSLPGMMTGQLLAGVDPVEAVKYQIAIMFLIASATAMGTMSVVLLSFRRLFNARHQFQYQLLQRRERDSKSS